MFEAFKDGTSIEKLGYVKAGLQTSDNKQFLRFWFEVNKNLLGIHINSKDNIFKWFPHNKGGKYRKWYGNQEYVVNWKNNGFEIKNFKLSVVRNPNFYFKTSISWSKVSSGNISFRYFPNTFIPNIAAGSIFLSNEHWEYIFGFLNSKISDQILGFISPTLNYNEGHIALLPLIFKDNNKIRIYLLLTF